MTPSSNHEVTDAGRQRRNRTVAGLLAGGAVLVTSLSSCGQTSPVDGAQASETVPTAAASKRVTPTAVVATPIAAPAPDPVAVFTAAWTAMTPDEQVAFRFMSFTEEERVNFVAFVNPPPPPAPVVKPAPTPKAAPKAPAPAPAPRPQAAPAPAATGGGGAGGFLACLRKHESGGNYSTNTGNGYYGAYQFLPSTWNSVASGAGRSDLVGVLPSNASPGDQDAIAQALLSRSGPGQWPVASRQC